MGREYYTEKKKRMKKPRKTEKKKNRKKKRRKEKKKRKKEKGFIKVLGFFFSRCFLSLFSLIILRVTSL